MPAPLQLVHSDPNLPKQADVDVIGGGIVSPTDGVAGPSGAAPGIARAVQTVGGFRRYYRAMRPCGNGNWTDPRRWNGPAF